jgi:hypothetical protein
MEAVAPYLFFWNEWVVFPALLGAAAVAYWKLRKASLLAVVAGMTLVLTGQALQLAFPAPLHPGYIASMFVYGAGFISGVAGFETWTCGRGVRPILYSSAALGNGLLPAGGAAKPRSGPRPEYCAQFTIKYRPDPIFRAAQPRRLSGSGYAR